VCLERAGKPVRHLNPDSCTFLVPLPELGHWQEHLQPSELEPLALASKKLTSQALAAIARLLVVCSRKDDISYGTSRCPYRAFGRHLRVQ
jgi:hypothetical protein